MDILKNRAFTGDSSGDFSRAQPSERPKIECGIGRT
jgi:hypothetical protein